MRTLVIDCATEACSVALFDNDQLVAGSFELLGRGHAERLVPMICELPGRGRADRIAASLGPGSFTGVRVGLAAARALGLAWDANVVGYSTMALVATMARESAGDVPVGIAMTGGHGEWFTAGFDGAGNLVRPLASLAPQDAVTATREEIVAGSMAHALVDARKWGTALDVLPDARRFAALPASAITSRLTPSYGREPDARLPATSR